jgi:hypothetical protein
MTFDEPGFYWIRQSPAAGWHPDMVGLPEVSIVYYDVDGRVWLPGSDYDLDEPGHYIVIAKVEPPE